MCECGKSYLSQPALNNHKKVKHPETLEGMEKRGRGRPRKYYPNPSGDFENTKYEPFFTAENRLKPETEEKNDLEKISNEVFDYLYNGAHKEGLEGEITEMKNMPILDKLSKNTPTEENNSEDKSKCNCDTAFYQYLWEAKDKTNQKYFTFMIKFVILFRECFNKVNKEKKDANPEANDSTKLPPETLPEICNDFYSVFMDKNDFFGFNEDEKTEMIELIQHFCIWLYKNGYTKSKLSLAG